MNTALMESKTDVCVNAKECVIYEHAGYKVRVYFVDNKTLVQCMKNIVERRI